MQNLTNFTVHIVLIQLIITTQWTQTFKDSNYWIIFVTELH